MEMKTYSYLYIIDFLKQSCRKNYKKRFMWLYLMWILAIASFSGGSTVAFAATEQISIELSTSPAFNALSLNKDSDLYPIHDPEFLHETLANLQAELIFFQETANQVGIVQTCLALGKLYLSLNEVENAIAFYEQGLSTLETLQVGLGTTPPDLGNTLNKQQELYNYQYGTLDAVQIEELSKQIENLQNLSSVYLLQADYKAAYSSYQELLSVIYQSFSANSPEISLNPEEAEIIASRISLEADSSIPSYLETLNPKDDLQESVQISGATQEEKPEIIESEFLAKVERLKQITHAENSTKLPELETTTLKQNSHAISEAEVECLESQDEIEQRTCYQMALDAAMQNLATAEMGDDQAAQATALLEIGIAYLGLEDVERAIAHLQQADEIFLEIDLLSGRIPVLRQLSIVYALQGQIEEELSVLLQLANVAYFIEHIDETIAAYERIVAIYQEQENAIAEAGARMDLGDVYLGERNYEEAAVQLQEAVRLYAQREQYLGDYIVASVKLSEAYLGLEEYGAALAISREALEMLENLPEDQRPEGLQQDEVLSSLKYHLYNNIGAAYLGQEQYDQAFASLRDSSESLADFAEEADRFLGRWPQQIRFLSGLSSLASFLFPASPLISNLTRLFTGTDALLAVSRSYYQIPSTVLERLTANEARDQFGDAREQYETLLELAQEQNDKVAEGNAYLGLGRAELALQNYSEAIEAFEDALEIFQELGTAREQEAETLLGLSNAEYSRGQYSEALAYAQQGYPC